MSEQQVSTVEKLIEGMDEATQLLGAASPLIPIIGGAVKLLIAEFKARGIDPGPTSARLDMAEAKADAILARQAAFEQRHQGE